MISNQCVILLGGMGTRLGDLTKETPKPLLPIDGTPFVEVLVGEGIRRGFREILLLAGYKADLVRAFVEGLKSRLPDDVKVHVSVEDQPLGTGGALRHASDYLSETFLLLNGDTWFDFNWLELFKVAGSGCAIAARHVPNADRHETLCLARDGRVTDIVPRRDQSGSGLVNGGVYVLRKCDLVAMPQRFSIEHDLLPRLIDRGELRGRKFDGFFLDIGIPETFALAQVAVPAQRRRPAVFFDRDGVLNHDDNYVGSADRFRWTDGAKAAVRRANELGYYVFVVTNQAGVARGFYDEMAVQSLHRWMAEELREEGAYVDDWRYCPFHPKGTVERYRSAHPWRKPEPGMLLDLLANWPVDASRSILIGDQESDCAAARAAGVQPYLFNGANLCQFLAERLPVTAEQGEP
jgi:D,D-heptose 1,7-bisphosphate phosphatase